MHRLITALLAIALFSVCDLLPLAAAAPVNTGNLPQAPPTIVVRRSLPERSASRHEAPSRVQARQQAPTPQISVHVQTNNNEIVQDATNADAVAPVSQQGSVAMPGIGTKP